MVATIVGWQEILPVIILVGPILAALPIITALWVYHDAKARQNTSATVWAVGAVLAWVPVLIVYLIVRPGTSAEQTAVDKHQPL